MDLRFTIEMIYAYLKRHYAGVAGIVVLVIISVLPLNSPGGRINHVYLAGIRMDYILHFAVFFAWSILWCWREFLLRDRQKIFWLRFFITGMLLAAGLEVIQAFIPWRTFNPKDLASNCLGIIAFLPFLFFKRNK